MSVIEDLYRKIQSLTDQLSLARDCMHEAMAQEFPVKVGDLVKMKGARHEGEIFKVSHLRLDVPQKDWQRWVWVYGHKQLKDGRFGQHEKNLFGDWEKL